MKYILTIFAFTLSLNSLGHETMKSKHSYMSSPWTMRASIATPNIQKTFKLVSGLDIDIAGVDINNGFVDILINENEFKTLENHGVDVEVVTVKGISKMPDDEYQNAEEVEAFIENTASKYPGITEKVSIGKSLEGRDIWALKISDNAHLDELDEPVLLFNSMHHAREVMSPEVGLDIIERLTSKYGVDTKVTRWVNDNTIWVMPMFNVDGNTKMWEGDRWWRKNTRGGYGVDLNRNYPTGWNKCRGSSGWRTSQTYRGPKPASEPETRVMMNFIENIRPVFDISYHAYSEIVIFPYGCKGERTQTKEVVEKIGHELGAKLNYKAGTAWELLYNADGGDIDWMYDAFQVIPFVVELNSRNEGFHPSYTQWRDKTVERNRAGWEYLLDRAHMSGVRGQVIAKSYIPSFQDIMVNVYKVTKDGKQFFQEYKLHKTGMFHLVLNPGIYNLEILGVNSKIVSSTEVEIKSGLKRIKLEI